MAQPLSTPLPQPCDRLTRSGRTVHFPQPSPPAPGGRLRWLLDVLRQGTVLLIASGFTALLLVVGVQPHLNAWIDGLYHPPSANLAGEPLHRAELDFGGDRPHRSQPLPAPLAHPQQGVSPATQEGMSPLALDYFLEIAFGSEFGESSPRLKKWVGPVQIQVEGTPTDADWAALHTILADLGAIAPALSVELTPHQGNVILYFVPPSQFSTYEPHYQAGNLGFFWANWDETHTITQATVLISSEGVSQRERSHLLREELTQALGLMQDSQRYPSSIFYDPWSQTTHYSALDAAVIAMLYSPQLQPGMTPQDALRALEEQLAVGSNDAIPWGVAGAR